MDGDLERIRASLREAQLDGRAVQEVEEVLRLVALERHLALHHPSRLAHVGRRAEEALGDPDQAWHWLRRPNGDLGLVPLDLLLTPEGEERVLQALGRIEFGVYA